MASKFVGALTLHASAAGTMAWGFDQLQYTVMDNYITQQVGGHFQFLTIQAYVSGFQETIRLGR